MLIDGCESLRIPQLITVAPPKYLDFRGLKRAWIEVHNDCLSEDFTRNLCECYVCWILEYVVVTVFRTLELDDEAMGCVSLGMRYFISRASSATRSARRGFRT